MTADNTNNLGLYIHIPFCHRKCPYCAFYSVPIDTADPNLFIDALFSELDRSEVTDPVETIYIGGGSPSCLPHELLTEIIISLASEFKDVPEFTIECNPAQADPDTLKTLHTLGVNRLSIGAQSFSAAELKTLGRIHDPEQITRAVRAAKDAGFTNISLDLIFGIPGSTPDTWKQSLQSAVEQNIQHISAYSLTIEEGTPFHRAVKEGTLSVIDEATDRAMYAAARQLLTDAGFAHYEISNFARPGHECRHNIRYWKNAPVLGLGPAAASWYKGRRITNIADVDEYIRKIESGGMPYDEIHEPGPEQIASETAVLSLRLIEGIDLHEYKTHTGFDLLELFHNAVKHHTATGLLECTTTHCRLTEKGLNYADTVAQDFAL